MTVTVISATSLKVDDNLILEWSPLPKSATATPELFSAEDSTIPKHYFIGTRDALGNIIVDGERFDYLDWLGEYGWYVYEKTTGIDEITHQEREYTTHIGTVFGDTQEAVVSAAKALLKK